MIWAVWMMSPTKSDVADRLREGVFQVTTCELYRWLRMREQLQLYQHHHLLSVWMLLKLVCHICIKFVWQLPNDVYHAMGVVVLDLPDLIFCMIRPRHFLYARYNSGCLIRFWIMFRHIQLLYYLSDCRVRYVVNNPTWRLDSSPESRPKEFKFISL